MKTAVRPAYGLWALFVGSIGAFVAGMRLAFVLSWEYGHFLKSLGVFLMFAGMIGWLTAATLLVMRIARSGRM